MAISLSRYVNIISGVGGGNTVSTRDLGARFFTNSALVPTGSYVVFTNAADVGIYFGASSAEYLRALFYFGWVSKNISVPRKISFAHWTDVAVGSKVFGKPATYALSSFTSITTGDFTLTMGGFTIHLTGINLSACVSLAAVAAAIQTKIQAQSSGGTAWTAATVTYDPTRSCFNLVSGATGNDTVAVVAGTTTDVASPLGWLTGAILSNGQGVQTISQVLTASADASNNFGSFGFIPSLSLAQVTEAANWNDSLDPNVQFIYSVPVSVANAAAWSAALVGIGGVTLTLSPLSSEYPEMVPMMILAATDYTARNSVQNYMFQGFNLTPSVTTNADANTYDALRINYYGQTQTAGQQIQFYQRGYMMGLSTDPQDQNTYANEIWFKDAIAASIMTLLLSLSQIPANATGRSQILAIVQSIINQALFNGTISPGKTLSTTQKLYITNATGDDKAWQQVQNIGYWVDARIVSFVNGAGTTEYKAVYTLIYSKDDVIRLVEGTDILI